MGNHHKYIECPVCKEHYCVRSEVCKCPYVPVGTKVATVIRFFADIPAGTNGWVIKQWETKGTKWATLLFGRNQGNQLLKKSFPMDCINIQK